MFCLYWCVYVEEWGRDDCYPKLRYNYVDPDCKKNQPNNQNCCGNDPNKYCGVDIINSHARPEH
jgi:hypothetical protein